MDEINQNIKKPKWLEILERQSWEAELIMSGLAIFGSTSLFPLVDEFIQICVVKFDDRVLDILSYAFLYTYAGLTLVVVSFIVHFALRLLWVGTLGLSSVYPSGINLDNEAYSKNFLEKAKKEFPSLSDYSLKLDKSCSIIFSILCMSVLMLVSISIWILIYIIISEILTLFIPDQIMEYIGWGIVVIFYIFALAISLMSTGRYKESAFAHKYAYKWTKGFGKLMGFYFYEPVNYISYTIRTNVSTKKFILGLGIILIVSMIFSLDKFDRATDYYSSKNYFELNQRVELASAKNYLDDFDDHLILAPIIQSQEIKDGFIKLFIPKYKRDNVYMKQICGEFEKDKDKPKNETRNLRETFRNECADQYFKLFINDAHVASPQFQITRHGHNDESGYECYIPIDSLLAGKHILKIETGYQNEKGGNAIRIIPFYKIKGRDI